MTRTLFLFLFIAVLASCDDGDIIVTSFDFEDADLSLCGEGTTKVLYKTNNDDIFESISLSFEDNDFTGEELGVITIDLNTSNQLVYRTFDNSITGSSYFCNEIPPTSPRVLQEFVSTNGGTATLTTTAIPDTEDEDGDGLTNDEENEDSQQDTDGDGILDYQDIDDDGDNVPTSAELGNTPDTMLLDTDEDGDPDYLDPDDDNDGIPTKNEDEDMDGNPRNDIGANSIARFKDVNETDSFDVPEEVNIENTYTVVFRTLVRLTNLTFSGQDIQAIQGTYDLGILEVPDVEITIEGN
ncbi:hypothetical protein [Croceibacter atlanticus]|uniref:hypothetical protein n=1 Tax=Croceibacter atlanticus TaxID=313588 RepID=UPI0030DB44E9|tara:strand:+ start:37539 stop:38429 length:891 start_codon:yes stop_codon:yes gene_type:complete